VRNFILLIIQIILLSTSTLYAQKSDDTEKVIIDFDLEPYRVIARKADGIITGPVYGICMSERIWGIVNEIAVLNKYGYYYPSVTLLNPGKHNLKYFKENQGNSYMFFWRFDRGLVVIDYFPLDDKHRKVLNWLNGESDSHTLFNPQSKSLIPKGIKIDHSIYYRDKKPGSLPCSFRIKITNTSLSSFYIVTADSGYYKVEASIHIINENGKVIWPGLDSKYNIPGNAGGPAYPGGPELKIIDQGGSLDICRSSCCNDPSDSLMKQRFRLLYPGVYFYHFIYDSTKCKDNSLEDVPVFKDKIIYYGKFEVK